MEQIRTDDVKVCSHFASAIDVETDECHLFIYQIYVKLILNLFSFRNFQEFFSSLYFTYFK